MPASDPTKPNMIPQDKAQEYREVAALVCQDLDLLLDMSKEPDVTMEMLRGYVAMFHGDKESYIHDAVARRRKYAAGCLIWGDVAAGLVRSDEVKNG